MKRKAPWTDFEGNDIHEGDALRHPSGEQGVVCFWPHEKEPGDQWRVFYAEHAVKHSRLCLQIGDKGRAVVVTPNVKVTGAPVDGRVRRLVLRREGKAMAAKMTQKDLKRSAYHLKQWSDVLLRSYKQGYVGETNPDAILDEAEEMAALSKKLYALARSLKTPNVEVSGVPPHGINKE